MPWRFSAPMDTLAEMHCPAGRENSGLSSGFGEQKNGLPRKIVYSVCMTWVGLVRVNINSVRNNTTAWTEEFTVCGFPHWWCRIGTRFYIPRALSKGRTLGIMRLFSSVNATEEDNVSGWSCLPPLKMEKGIQCPLSYFCCLTLCISGNFCNKQLMRINFQCGHLMSQLRQSNPVLLKSALDPVLAVISMRFVYS